jgi:hypothetical protein
MDKKMSGLRLGGLISLFLSAVSQSPAQTQPGLISADKLTQVPPHVWMIRAFPNIGFVVGTTGTLVIDTGLGAKNGQIVADLPWPISGVLRAGVVPDVDDRAFLLTPFA